MPVLRDAAGSTFLDVRTLYLETGICTFDPGFNSTASCASTITFIDGDKGRLLYRGQGVSLCVWKGAFRAFRSSTSEHQRSSVCMCPLQLLRYSA